MNAKTEKIKSNGPVYANLLCDFMFKRLFGSVANKDVLIGFLNMLLEDSEIIDVDFIPTEHLGLTKEDRKAIFDISCKCKNGTSFIIEIQKGYQKHFRKRAVFYTTYPINEQGRHARDTFIRFHSSYRLREDVTGEVMTNVLRFVFLELGRFKKHIWELENFSDKWMYLLRHMHEMDEIPEKFSDPLFRRLFMLSKIGNFTTEEQKQYEDSMKDMSDYYNIIETAAEEAEKRGVAKGREEGVAYMLRKMLDSGMTLDNVMEITGLSKEQISIYIKN